ncbi:HAD-hyrolase-like protein [Aureococcus anophagefferens]|nr:HAD-hyrolase-like protein [Aureococcus anophagefferens]
MSAMSTNAAKPVLRGVVFDMDGTLTVPNLDFKLMYERCGVPMSEDILEAIAKMPPADADAANAVIDEMEAEGRRTLRLMPAPPSRQRGSRPWTFRRPSSRGTRGRPSTTCTTRSGRPRPAPGVAAPDASANTPLVWAANAGHADCVAFLLAAGVAADAPGFLGATAVCRAARVGNVDALRALLDAGADPNLANDKLQSPLHFAAFKRNPACVAALLDAGASTLILDRKGRTPDQDTKDAAIIATILAARARAPRDVLTSYAARLTASVSANPAA